MTRLTPMTRMTVLACFFLLPAALSAPPVQAASGPVHLHLTVERQTVTADAQGKSKTVWVALDAQSAVHPGDMLRYDVSAENTGAASVSGLIVTQPVPAGTVYVAHSAESAKAGAASVLYSLDGRQFSALPMQAGPEGISRPAAPQSYTALRWRFPILPPHASQNATYLVKVR